MKPTVYVIVGATATGKTKLAIEMAKELNGEIISADSMQVYRELNIGTAKPTKYEMKGITHFMIDICDPNYSYSVGEYQKQALNCLKDITTNNKTPIIVGGSGLYINSLTYNLSFSTTPSDLQFRQSLQERTNEELYRLLKSQNNKAAEHIHPNNRNRVIRALEIAKSDKFDNYNFNNQSKNYNFKIIGLKYNREALYQRINSRVDKMIEKGLENEVRDLYNKYGNAPTAFQGIGYKEFISYFNNKYTKDFAIDKIKQHSRNLAKRQHTWFKRDNRIKWYEGESSCDFIDYILESL